MAPNYAIKTKTLIHAITSDVDFRAGELLIFPMASLQLETKQIVKMFGTVRIMI